MDMTLQLRKTPLPETPETTRSMQGNVAFELEDFNGEGAMSMYLGQPELTASVFEDGWYVTCDLADVDASGFGLHGSDDSLNPHRTPSF